MIYRIKHIYGTTDNRPNALCKVYFFFSDQIDALKEKRINDMIFVNENIQNDSSIKVIESFYMIASYSDKTDKQYKSLLGVNALTVKDDDFNAVYKAFPYYIKMPEDLPKYKKVRKKIYNFDRELRTFYYMQPVQKQDL
jgi:hypothetical protein